MPPGASASDANKLPLYKRPPNTPFGPKIAKKSDEAKYHPLLDGLKTTFTPMSVADRTAVLNFRLNWLRARATAAGNALTAAGFAVDLPSKMIQATSDHWPLRNLGQAMGQLDFRLNLQQSVGVHRGDPEVTDTANAYALILGGTVDAAAADPGASALLMMQIRCLADVYGRWEVGARLTQELVGVQFIAPPLTASELLARILTFWRVEGDMSLPPENDTLDSTAAGSDTPVGIPVVPLPAGRSNFKYTVMPRAHMYFVTWLAKANQIQFQDPWTRVWSQVNWSDPVTAVKFADMAFNFALAGLDILWKADFEAGAEGTTFTSQFQWVSLNWQVPADAQTAYNRRQQLLGTVSFPGPPQAVVRVAGVSAASYSALVPAPKYSGASAEYASSVLGEAIRYMNRLTSGPTRFGPGAAPRVPELLVYLLYHAGGSQFRAVIASAAAHAVLPKSHSAGAVNLRNALPADFSDPKSDNGKLLRDIQNGSTENSELKATAAWPSVADGGRGWGLIFGSDAVLKALDAYIRDEKDTVWGSWVKTKDKQGATVRGPRANVIQYDNLYQHHYNLFK